jgi:hypothetical protein
MLIIVISINVTIKISIFEKYEKTGAEIGTTWWTNDLFKFMMLYPTNLIQKLK